MKKLPYEEVLNLDGRLIFVSPSESFSLFLLNVLIQIRIWNMNANPKLLIPKSLCIRIHNTPASIIFLLQARKAGGWMIWSWNIETTTGQPIRHSRQVRREHEFHLQHFSAQMARGIWWFIVFYTNSWPRSDGAGNGKCASRVISFRAVGATPFFGRSRHVGGCAGSKCW